MRSNELYQFLKQRPFEPIRIYLSSGERVDIRHPEQALVTRSLVAIGMGGKNGVSDYLVHYNLIHIVKIEPIRAQPQSRRARSAGRN